MLDELFVDADPHRSAPAAQPDSLFGGEFAAALFAKNVAAWQPAPPPEGSGGGGAGAAAVPAFAGNDIVPPPPRGDIDTPPVNADGNGAEGSTDSGTVSLMSFTNTPPSAFNDDYSVHHAQMLNVFSPGVLANDYDIDMDPLTAVLASGPGNGSLTLNSDGSFHYQAQTGFTGTDSFTYQAYDGIDYSTPATVNIVVWNNAPDAQNDNYTLTGTQLSVNSSSGVLANDSDVDGDMLQAVLESGPVNGSLTLNSDGSFLYTPNAGMTSDSFTYRATDGVTPSSPATVQISHSAPHAGNDDYSIQHGQTLNVLASGVLANDWDPEGSQLTAIFVSGPNNGSLTLNSDGSFSYTPDANWAGMDSFMYKANDGVADSTPATVYIEVESLPFTFIEAAGWGWEGSDLHFHFLVHATTGTITEYAVDINGDGSFDVTTTEHDDLIDGASLLYVDQAALLGSTLHDVYPALVRVTHSSGVSRDYQFDITIENTPPLVDIQLLNSEPVFTYESTQWSLSVFDPGANSVSEIQVDWGDNTVAIISGTITQVSHTFQTEGLYYIEVTAVDDDGVHFAGYAMVEVHQAGQFLGTNIPSPAPLYNKLMEDVARKRVKAVATDVALKTIRENWADQEGHDTGYNQGLYSTPNADYASPWGFDIGAVSRYQTRATTAINAHNNKHGTQLQISFETTVYVKYFIIPNVGPVGEQSGEVIFQVFVYHKTIITDPDADPGEQEQVWVRKLWQTPTIVGMDRTYATPLSVQQHPAPRSLPPEESP